VFRSMWVRDERNLMVRAVTVGRRVRTPWTSSALIAAVFVASSSFRLALAQDYRQPVPPIHVAVLGQPIEWKDIWAFMAGLYKSPPDSPQIKTVWKAPTAMPSDAPYVSYEGRDSGPRPTEVIWAIRSSPTWTSDPNFEQKGKVLNNEYVAAVALAVMDAGNAGATLQAIYAQTSSDRASRLALGNAVAQALQSASDQAAAFTASDADWIRAHIVPGMTRTAAYEMLKSKGLIAYNWAFVKGRAIPAPAAPAPAIGGGCDMSDASSGAWPYKGQPLPKQEGVCAQWSADHPPKSSANPEARLELEGAFNLSCSWSTYIEIRFRDDDRVKDVQIDEPRSTCL
jgi:hypothetical protein